MNDMPCHRCSSPLSEAARFCDECGVDQQSPSVRRFEATWLTRVRPELTALPDRTPTVEWESCEIVFQERYGGRQCYVAKTAGAGDARTLLAEPVRLLGTRQCALSEQIVARMAAALVDDGWIAQPDGVHWYSRRFRRPASRASEPLEAAPRTTPASALRAAAD